MSNYFHALVTEEKDGQFVRQIRERSVNDLPEGELLVKVHYSSLNYKDALSALGRPGVTKRYPHTPGIDAAGEVVSCANGAFAAGDQVIVTGYDLGMNTTGGYSQYIRVPSAWAVRLPKELTLRESMILGTAGLTAGLSLHQLARGGVRPEGGEVLVTGATGGVGSIAVSILAKAGYTVVAATGKSSEHEFLQALGARHIISREELLRDAHHPLLKTRWNGVLDVVGGEMLAAAIKSTNYGGVVTCCGLAASPELPLNVFPFILRAVSLVGIDSAQCPTELRREVWQRLAGEWRPEHLLQTATEVPLDGLEESFHAILKGESRGRTVVNLIDA
ncbi:YhdH/YhfP family quinone oxidoreductase [Geomonas sp.]|uniref:YhdH/YhfP family quinone oxidoreductase n=1 Tax=Geomonas sp. TaxID=2651584 RepID=UPI002B49F6F0|nr:YhdH/YhfP family quinone oxidoreductase [Geomonas sp.]HJV34903.1 YhdH/YhfP family quinone oxidoreductase [Geomonas sp.]